MSKIVDEVVNIFEKDFNKQVVLYGPPGTSKTYSATKIAAKFLSDKYKDGNGKDMYDYGSAKAYLEEHDDRYKLVQFHPSYSYEDFVRGIKVDVDSDTKEVTYKVDRQIIEEFGEGATKESPKVLVIDEINRAPLASVLGELIYGLEYRGNPVTSPYKYNGNSDIVIPEGLYIIGTMNTADRSIGSMDYAVRRRFAFVAVPSSKEGIMGTWKNNTEVGELAEQLYDKLIEDKEGIFERSLIADQEMETNDIKIGHTYFLGKKELSSDRAENEDYLVYRIIYQIWPIYNEYIKDGLIDNSNNKRAVNRFVDCLKNGLQDEEGNWLFETDEVKDKIKKFCDDLLK